MASLSKGTTFSNGVTYSATDLNNLVDSAAILPGAILDRTSILPNTGTLFLSYDPFTSGLARCSLLDIINALPADDVGINKSLRTLGTGAQQAVAGNDGRLSASVTGLRLGAGGGSLDTAAAPKDTIFPPLNINALTTVNLDLADVFYDNALTSNKTYTLTNARSGYVKVFQIFQNGHTVAFSGGWIVFGTANTAGWNIYSIVLTPGITGTITITS